MPRHGEQGERVAEKAGVGAQWRNSQNQVKAKSIMQLKTASYCTCIRRQTSVAPTILILSLTLRLCLCLTFLFLLFNEKSGTPLHMTATHH